MLFLTFLMHASSVNDTAIVQERINELVRRCHASEDIRFVAHPGNEVEIQLLTRSAALTTVERRRLTCVFDGLKSMPELSFGFIGNASPNGS
ncbi:hypothetical protein H7F51_09810 [Novosphingobium flavum]|uniref:Uncharacterized protein n=1 Tax=Novosphingobium flavum TaxID=1778672 RepID=A0A7X1KLP7_9SPHN|nr:hypothetical protein [Novosphingobium flavum]MBC2665819.1 hypothetical protein [Novosphingobium flavum]